MYVYKTTGTCAKEIHLEVQDGIIRSVEFILGCPGFTQALSRMLAGIPAEQAIARLEGIPVSYTHLTLPTTSRV